MHVKITFIKIDKFLSMYLELILINYLPNKNHIVVTLSNTTLIQLIEYVSYLYMVDVLLMRTTCLYSIFLNNNVVVS